MSGVEIAMAAAAAAKVGGQLIQGVSSYNNGMMQAKLSQRESEAASKRAAAEQEATMMEGQTAIGEARANVGAYGFDGSGTAAEIIGNLSAQQSAAARMSIYEGEAQRQALLTQAKSQKANAKAQLASAALAASAEAISAAVGINAEMADRKASAAKIDAYESAADGQYRTKLPEFKVPPMGSAPKQTNSASFGSRVKLFGRTIYKRATFGGGN